MRPTSLCRTTSCAVRWQKERSSTSPRMLSAWRSPLVVPFGQVDLGDVARDDHPRAEAEARQEHLHLLHEVFCASSRMMNASLSVRPRMKASGATSIVPAVSRRGISVGVEHVVQGVVERAHVRVDLVVQRAGQEAQVLAGLDGRPGQDDPVDLLGLQRLDGLGHGEVRLAGAGRADAEDHRVLVDRVDVALLVQRLGPDRLAARREDVVRQHVRGAARPPRSASIDTIRSTPSGGEALAGAEDGDELGDHVDAEVDGGRGARERDLVAADVHAGGQLALEDAQELVAGAEQVDHLDRDRDGDPPELLETALALLRLHGAGRALAADVRRARGPGCALRPAGL